MIRLEKEMAKHRFTQLRNNSRLQTLIITKVIKLLEVQMQLKNKQN